VSCSAVDAAGLAANGDFTVNVNDTRAPALTLPGDLSVQATTAEGAEVAYQASASDSVDGAIGPTCAPPSGHVFRVGTTKVRCSATDEAGNTATGSFAVAVRDRTKPSLTLPTTIRKTTSSREGLHVDDPASATDLVDGSVPVTCEPRSGSTFQVGSTRVRCFTTDRAGNTARGRFRVVIKLVEIRTNQESGTPPAREVTHGIACPGRC
jgi:hypothetical protein